MANSSHGEDTAQAELRTSWAYGKWKKFSKSSRVKRNKRQCKRGFYWPKMRYSENPKMNYCGVFKHNKYIENLSP